MVLLPIGSEAFQGREKMKRGKNWAGGQNMGWTWSGAETVAETAAES